MQADWILAHATVIPMDGASPVISDGAVAVQGETLLAVGPSARVLETFSAANVMDCTGRVLLPGLVNAHTHVPMTLLRGLADDRRLDVWLLGYMMPVEREFVSPDFCRLGTLLACAEMIRGGVTCFADMYYFEDSVARATAEAGMRAVCSQTVLKFPSPDAASYEDSLAMAREFITAWRSHPLITPSVAPHAPYTTTPDILRACAQLAIEFDVPLHIHLAETAQEVDDCRAANGMPVIPWVKKQSLLEAKVLAAHCVHIDEGEIHTLKRANAGVAHNPSSNLKLASGFAPVAQMLAEGLPVGIGTDGPASNNDLDMFEEMRLASFLAKATTGNPTALPAAQTLAMATRLGAQALHLGDVTGSLEPGKRADLILVDLRDVHTSPAFAHEPEAVISRLVYSARSTDVTDVMVNGRWLMRDRKLLTIDVGPLLDAAAVYARRIDAFLVEREGSLYSRLVAIGGAEQGESYEVQIKLHLENPESVVAAFTHGGLEIIRRAHYREYDTYFSFGDASQGRLRHREDEFIDEQGEVSNVRYRLTLTGPAAERRFPNSALLSRSRFIAPATHSLRFYREYFKPEKEAEVSKERLRWMVRFEGEEFFVNIDHMLKPKIEGAFLEIKSRTWSRLDAEEKALKINALLEALGVQDARPVEQDYAEMAGD
ncbi:MAG: amidohydrolase [Anaerolineales bacterium]|nr:amidohydrolase [Anaerolineales bacterium]